MRCILLDCGRHASVGGSELRPPLDGKLVLGLVGVESFVGSDRVDVLSVGSHDQRFCMFQELLLAGLRVVRVVDGDGDHAKPSALRHVDRRHSFSRAAENVFAHVAPFEPRNPSFDVDCVRHSLRHAVQLDVILNVANVRATLVLAARISLAVAAPVAPVAPSLKLDAQLHSECQGPHEMRLGSRGPQHTWMVLVRLLEGGVLDLLTGDAAARAGPHGTPPQVEDGVEDLRRLQAHLHHVRVALSLRSLSSIRREHEQVHVPLVDW